MSYEIVGQASVLNYFKSKVSEITQTPAFGYNGMYLGGWKLFNEAEGRTQTLFGNAKLADDTRMNVVTSSLAQVNSPTTTIAFASTFLGEDRSYTELPDFEGAKYVMSPPLRDKRNQPILWNGLRSGAINTVATDHAPFDFVGQKEMGKDDFTKIPNGIPSLEDRVNLLYTYGVKQGRLDLNRFVDVASTQVAKLFGLFPMKGSIQLGADADLVVYDPEYQGTISAKTHHLNVDYSSFEGWPIEGRPSIVTVRGKIQVRDGQFVGTAGHGKFLKREPNHF